MFHHSSFQPLSFSIQSFKMAGQTHTQDARSGYWRLFYYQMQEEALKTGEAEKAKPAEATPEVVAEEKPIETKAKPKAKVEKLAFEPTPAPSKPPMRLKPVYRAPEHYDVRPALNVASTEHFQQLSAFLGLKYESLLRQAQNDEDDILILLLAA